MSDETDSVRITSGGYGTDGSNRDGRIKRNEEGSTTGKNIEWMRESGYWGRDATKI
jgi:hypothetical protein